MARWSQWRSLFRDYQPPMAVQVSYGSVRCLWLERVDGQFRVRHAAARELPSDTFRTRPGHIEVRQAEALAEALKSVLPEPPRPTRGDLILPDAAGMFFMVEIDDWPLRRRQQEELVRWHLRQQIPYPMEECRITFQVLHAAGSRHTVGILAVWSPFLQTLEDLCAGAGYVPGRVLPESYYIENFVWVYPAVARQIADRRAMLLHWDGERLVMTLFDRGRLRIKRSRTLGAPDETVPEPLHSELQRLLAYLEDYVPDAIPDRVLFSGPHAPQMAAHVPDALPMATLELFTGIRALDWPPELDRSPAWLPLFAALWRMAP